MSDVTGASAPPSAAGSSPAPSTAAPTPSSASSSPASASVTPASDPGSSVAPASEPGPIPYARFKEVNDQLKTMRDFREQYGWAEQFQQDPYTFVDNWVDQLANHPQYSSQILAKAARMLSARRGQQPAAPPEEPQPDIPVMDAQGNVVSQTYSAKALKAWREWEWAQRETQLNERMQPLEQMRTRMEQQAQMAQVQQQSDSYARSTLEELRGNPYFKEHEAKVKRALMEHEDWGDNVHRAFNHVMLTEILPTLSQSEQGKVLAHLKTQAAGASVAPGASTPTQSPKFKDFGEALRYYAEHPDEAQAMANR